MLRRATKIGVAVWLACAVILSGIGPVFAQSSTTGTAVGVACAADGSSTQVQAANAKRYSFTIINDAGKDVRIGFIAGSSTPDLTDSNSFVLKSGASYADSYPGVFVGRVVCMSTDASTATIHTTQTVKQ